MAVFLHATVKRGAQKYRQFAAAAPV